MTPDESLEKAKQSLAEDVASITYRGSLACGKHGLVSMDLESRELIVRHSPGGKPVYRRRMPDRAPPDQLSRLLMQIAPPPSLDGANAFLEDLTAILMVHFTQNKRPDLSQIRLSSDAADRL